MRPRRARLDEARRLAELQLRVALHAYAEIFPPEAPKPTVDDLLPHWDDACRYGGAFIVDRRGAVTGVVVAGPDPADESVGHLSRLYVAPEYWGRGIGRKLYDKCLDELRERGFEAATLWVLERNEKARAWYERLGWRLTDARRPVYAPARIDDVSYRLQLRPVARSPRSFGRG